jgi:ASC-1-like (ASCH) protein
MEHHMHLNPLPFDLIGRGKKTIEARLNDEKRQKMSVGDEIVFEEMEHPENTMRARIVALHRCSSFAELFAAHDPKFFGGEGREELTTRIRSIYPEDEEKKYGVVGIEIALV